MASPLDPDFAKRNIFSQPTAGKDRVAYRSPIDSEKLSLHSGRTAADITALYDKYEALVDQFQSYIDDVYEDGEDTLEQHALRLSYIKQHVDTLSSISNPS